MFVATFSLSGSLLSAGETRCTTFVIDAEDKVCHIFRKVKLAENDEVGTGRAGGLIKSFDQPKQNVATGQSCQSRIASPAGSKNSSRSGSTAKLTRSPTATWWRGPIRATLISPTSAAATALVVQWLVSVTTGPGPTRLALQRRPLTSQSSRPLNPRVPVAVVLLVKRPLNVKNSELSSSPP
jgi:hypothetical protein